VFQMNFNTVALFDGLFGGKSALSWTTLMLNNNLLLILKHVVHK
jgi:hypothetical protein